MEITQFTYFQQARIPSLCSPRYATHHIRAYFSSPDAPPTLRPQAGSLPLKPVAVEITYGLERILMSLQRVNHFRDIRYNDVVTYGECFLQNEQEMSKYNLEVADVANQRQRCAHARGRRGIAGVCVALRCAALCFSCVVHFSCSSR